jgi:hypothetical protein
MDSFTERHRLVGPPDLWEAKRKFQFDFLLQAGLLPGHTLLDLGCGTLRGGIPLIGYLDEGNYTGVEVRHEVIREAWLELGISGLEYKKPTLICTKYLSTLILSRKFDFIWAFSVLIHLEDDILEGVLKFISRHLKKEGSFYANVVFGQSQDGRWQQFPLVERPESFYSGIGNLYGLTMRDLGSLEKFGHPSKITDKNLLERQRMLRFTLNETKPGGMQQTRPICSSQPDFLIIGAQKCGTTSLFNYLSQHPELFLPDEKEVHFFDLQYHLGIDWYRNIFNTGEEGRVKLKGEASPYYIFHPLVAERVFRHFPGVKLIVLLRDPVDRAYSHYMHSRRMELEPMGSFEDAIESEPARTWDEKRRILSGEIENSDAFRNFSYISRGLYFQQISHWLKYFPREQIYCIKSEELFTNPGPVYSELCSFLGISDYNNVKFEPQNAFSYAPLSKELRNKIRTHFHDDMSGLAQLLGDRFYWE